MDDAQLRNGTKNPVRLWLEDESKPIVLAPGEERALRLRRHLSSLQLENATPASVELVVEVEGYALAIPPLTKFELSLLREFHYPFSHVEWQDGQTIVYAEVEKVNLVNRNGTRRLVHG